MEYTRRDIEQIIGISATRIRLLGDRGMLTLGTQFPGRGVGRVYSWTNLMEIAIIHEFSKHGLELRAIGRFLDFIRNKIPQLLEKDFFEPGSPRLFLYENSGHVSWVISRTKDEPISTFLGTDASTVVVDVTRLARSLSG